MVSRNADIGTGIGGSQVTIRCTVSPGETTRVTLGGMGRPVVGKVVLRMGRKERAFSEGTIQFYTIHFSAKADPANVPRFPRFDPAPEFYGLSPEARAQWARRWKEVEYTAYTRSRWDLERKYPGGAYPVTGDGTFRLEDVLPGVYEAKIDLYGAPASKWQRGQQIGSGEIEFKVPSMPDGSAAQPVDLGTIVVTMSAENEAPPSVISPGRANEPAPRPTPAASTDRMALEKYFALMTRPVLSDHEKRLAAGQFVPNKPPDGFLDNVRKGKLKVGDIYTLNQDGWAHMVAADGKTHYTVLLFDTRRTWWIAAAFKLSAEGVRADKQRFLAGHPGAKLEQAKTTAPVGRNGPNTPSRLMLVSNTGDLPCVDSF
jgi:hypothetical protein